MCEQLSTRWQNGKGDTSNLHMQAHMLNCALRNSAITKRFQVSLCKMDLMKSWSKSASDFTMSILIGQQMVNLSKY